MSVVDRLGPGFDGRGRALFVDGDRVGYDRSHVLTPDIVSHTTCETRRALARYTRYHHDAHIVWWSDERGQKHWKTALNDEIERKMLRMAGKRERGLRWNVRALARSLHTSPSTVTRVIRNLRDRGIVTWETTKGRYSRFAMKVVARSMHQPYKDRGGALTSSVYEPIPKGEAARMWDRYSDEEQARLEALAYAYRVNIGYEAREAGYENVDDYIASFRR